MTSPNGEWMAETSFEQLDGNEEYRIQFKTYRVDGAKIWSIVDERQAGLGYAYTRLHQWSHDSRYFYFSSFHVPDGGCGDFFPIIPNWQRLDVNSGEISNYPLPTGRGHTLSPDDARLAYSGVGVPVQVHLRDLSSGGEQAWSLPLSGPASETAQAGNILWSPSGEAFVVAAASSAFCAASGLEFSLWRINVASPEPVALVSEGEALLWPLSWVDDDFILVRDWDHRTWWMDAESGQPTTVPDGVAP